MSRSQVLLLAGFACVGAGTGAEEFAQDVDWLLENFARTHPAFDHAHPREEWNAAAAALKALAPPDAREGAAVDALRAIELLRLVALAADGHSALAFESTPLWRRLYPFRLRVFGNDLVVVAAAPALEQCLGGRIVSVGSAGRDDVVEKLRPLCPADNAARQLERMGFLLRIPAVHRALGFIPVGSAGQVVETSRLVVEKPDGQQVEVELVPEEQTSALAAFTDTTGWLFAPHALSRIETLAARHARVPWWFECLDDEWTVYARIDSITEPVDGSFAGFCRELFAFIEKNDIERLVIDLRENGGGNNYLTQPLIHGVIRCDRVNRPGHLFVLTSARTFSAAVNCAARLERETCALFAGEATGAGPNHFGDATSLRLPRTGFVVRCSTVRWQDSDPRDTRTAILPDLLAPATRADFIAGKEAALEAALDFDPADAAATELATRAPIQHWQRPSQARR